MSNSIKFLKFVRTFHTQMQLVQKNHYDTLGVSAKATQADIKSAYYKLSMVYHPDKNQTHEEASTRFRDITEAYEVLGNVKTRKLYDRGLLIDGKGIYDTTPVNKFYKSRDVRTRPTVEYGRTTVYDFDEWSRSHYGDTFQKTQQFKKKERIRIMREKQNAEDIKSEKMILLIGLMFLLGAYMLCEKDYDNPSNENVKVFGGHILVAPPKSN